MTKGNLACSSFRFLFDNLAPSFFAPWGLGLRRRGETSASLRAPKRGGGLYFLLFRGVLCVYSAMHPPFSPFSRMYNNTTPKFSKPLPRKPIDPSVTRIWRASLGPFCFVIHLEDGVEVLTEKVRRGEAWRGLAGVRGRSREGCRSPFLVLLFSSLHTDFFRGAALFPLLYARCNLYSSWRSDRFQTAMALGQKSSPFFHLEFGWFVFLGVFGFVLHMEVRFVCMFSLFGSVLCLLLLRFY